jgi:hypothetical protein
MYSARDGHDEDLPCRAGLIILSARVARGDWRPLSGKELGTGHQL